MTSSPPDPRSPFADWPRTRSSNWRARSPLARLFDAIVATAGAALIGVSLLDAFGSFWHNHVFIYPASLEEFAGAVLLPCWPWLLVSGWMISGNPRRLRKLSSPRRRRRVSWRAAAPWVGAFGVIVAVLVVGFVLGASKGTLRVLPGGVHQVSTLDLNSAQWTTVSPAEYRLWAARFIREDTFFATFGLAMVGFAAGMRLLRQGLAAAGL